MAAMTPQRARWWARLCSARGTLALFVMIIVLLKSCGPSWNPEENPELHEQQRRAAALAVGVAVALALGSVALFTAAAVVRRRGRHG